MDPEENQLNMDLYMSDSDSDTDDILIVCETLPLPPLIPFSLGGEGAVLPQNEGTPVVAPVVLPQNEGTPVVAPVMLPQNEGTPVVAPSQSPSALNIDNSVGIVSEGNQNVQDQDNLGDSIDDMQLEDLEEGVSEEEVDEEEETLYSGSLDDSETEVSDEGDGTDSESNWEDHSND